MYIFQPDRHLLQRQIEKLSSYFHGSVLDVGAGLFDRYSHLFSVSQYIRMEQHSGPGIDLVGSAENIPCPSETFDGVVCTQVLEHVQHPNLVAKEIARVLKPGGYCLVTVPQSSELHEEPTDYFRYTSYGLVSLFGDVGMECLEMDARGGYWTLMLYTGVRYCIDRFRLYQRPYVGKIASKIFKLVYLGTQMIDNLDHSDASRRHTIGWASLFQKRKAS